MQHLIMLQESEEGGDGSHGSGNSKYSLRFVRSFSNIMKMIVKSRSLFAFPVQEAFLNLSGREMSGRYAVVIG